jgi:hypothetical protein
MFLLILLFLAWCGGSYLVYIFLAPGFLIAYGLLTLAILASYVFFANRKPRI